MARGSLHGPRHTGLFETRTNYGAAASFDDSRPDREVLTAQLFSTSSGLVERMERSAPVRLWEVGNCWQHGPQPLLRAKNRC
jgi:hypothetical protein